MTSDCPVCHVPLRPSATCPSCGAWWLSAKLEEVPPVSASEPVGTVSVPLWSPIPFVRLAIFLPFAVLGVGAAVAPVLVLAQDPGSGWAWVSLAAGLPLGGYVGAMFVCAIVQEVLRTFVPTRLDGEATCLRVRAWHTWFGIWDGFRRTDVRVPRAEVTGIGLWTGQGGERQVCVRHASGLALGTGWGGRREDAIRQVEPLLAWIGSRDVTSPE